MTLSREERDALARGDDGSASADAGALAVSPAEVPTGVPHLARACELLWQAGHPAIAEALEREVRQEVERLQAAGDALAVYARLSDKNPLIVAWKEARREP